MPNDELGDERIFAYGNYRDSLQMTKHNKYGWSGYWEPIDLIIQECNEKPDYMELGVGG